MVMKVSYLSRILLLLYVAAVCLLCFLHIGNGISMNDTWLGFPRDKVLHFLMFLPFPVLMYMAFHKPAGKPWRLIFFLLVTIVIGAIAGGAIELIQKATGYRSCDILDFRADCIGLLAGCIIMLIYGAISKKW